MNTEELINLWNLYVPRYIALQTSHNVIEFPSNNKETGEVAYFLKEIFEHLTKKAAIRDKWDFRWQQINTGVFVYATSNTQHHDYTISIFNGELYLESYIYKAQNIKYMSKDFWSLLSDLDLMNGFKFQENAGLPKINSFDTKVGSSSTYKLIRNYTILEEHDPESTIDLGWFEGRWQLSKPSRETLDLGAKTLKGIHKLNYFLYRCEYQKKRRKEAKQ